jgi:hypothetical protein
MIERAFVPPSEGPMHQRRAVRDVPQALDPRSRPDRVAFLAPEAA